MRRIDHPVATAETASGLVETLSTTTRIRCQAPAVSGCSDVYKVRRVLGELLARGNCLEAVLCFERLDPSRNTDDHAVVIQPVLDDANLLLTNGLQHFVEQLLFLLSVESVERRHV